ncbi:Sulfotransferase domain-containing protein [Desulfacinum infernum DSM 9756]|uniref:Sulfotransferase domain-containing protein n=1 Tax=Desulfacinum infernum DSM 9756 TaxID=1121391 RepID=A0A1M5CSS5_9BACT|nr:sulfotransferase [Desulfacinum infernum]SHF57677.1 Sulfotransferase domain-containing protein [Desulfacinum infernum DSM 9756]
MKNQKIIPNLFLIGAPKAGTTAMSKYLGDHPNIFLCDPKEPDYFNDDFSNRYVTNLEKYLSLFSAASSDCMYFMDASTRYLQSERAVENILEFNPESKFIVMLRNPCEIIVALHSQYVYEGYDDQVGFERAWRLEPYRKRGKYIPEICIEPKMLYYREACLLGRHIERLYGYVSKDRVHVIIFDDFVQNAKKVYETLLEFLGIPSDGRENFERVNPRRGYRFQWLQSLVLRLGNLKRRVGITRGLGIYNVVKKFNVVTQPTDRISEELLQEMKGFFREDVKLLSEYVERDLTHWVE